MTEKQSSKTESFPTQAQVVIIGGAADGYAPDAHNALQGALNMIKGLREMQARK
jgi:hypothetical protein